MITEDRPMAGARSVPRGICSGCDREYGLTTAGMVHSHWRPVERRSRGDWDCPGVGRPPKSTIEDPIEAAEERGRQRGRAEAIADLRDDGALLTWWLTECPDTYCDLGARDHLADYLEAKERQA